MKSQWRQSPVLRLRLPASILRGEYSSNVLLQGSLLQPRIIIYIVSFKWKNICVQYYHEHYLDCIQWCMLLTFDVWWKSIQGGRWPSKASFDSLAVLVVDIPRYHPRRWIETGPRISQVEMTILFFIFTPRWLEVDKDWGIEPSLEWEWMTMNYGGWLEE